jgi:5-methylcytosine-specific restriction endonuclease McrA
MKRTLTSKKLRNLLAISQNCKCAECGIDLDKGYHADHDPPFSAKPETNVNRMQALCPKCNLRKGKKYDPKKAPG